MNKSNKPFEKSSGNVFHDLTVTNANAALMRSELTINLSKLLDEKKWSMAEQCEFLDITRSELRKIQQGDTSDFTIEMLLNFIGKFDKYVVTQLKQLKK